ncbi:C39 family peptidase [Streptacidiphilus sp. P02-A3a]|uniref:C39 family peptidase n=1 Tax=Streptacidiphilus sp. P02-A3a TaxID=2704468 RepID=UPI0015FCDBF5|nr:C39 family peptidase [Streptacidiphilus sp. P02-A3a]QMU73422.1 hypothetical protein GXP74_39565 [Streptacidiphilus sp. P02-A3a]
MTTSPTTNDPADGGVVRNQVPYYSQWETPELVGDIIGGRIDAADDPAWHRSGAETAEEYGYWSWRACGMACLRMALRHWQGSAPPMMDLARDLLAAGAYVKRPDGGLDGLIYAPFAVRVQQRFGLLAQARPELPVADVRAELRAGRLVMLSVHPAIRTHLVDPPRRGGHLVLAVGADPGAVTFHNPSGLYRESQEYARVPWDRLEPFYAGRGVVLGRTAEA